MAYCNQADVLVAGLVAGRVDGKLLHLEVARAVDHLQQQNHVMGPPICECLGWAFQLLENVMNLLRISSERALRTGFFN